MAQILKFDEVPGYGIRQKPRVQTGIVRNDLRVEEPDDFWLGASKGLWSKQPIPTNPDNSAGCVLTETVMVLGGAALLVLLTLVFFGAPYT